MPKKAGRASSSPIRRHVALAPAAKRSRRNHELRDAKQMDQRRRPSGSVLASRPTAGLCFARLRPAHGREADAAEASAAVLASGTWL